MFKHADCRHLSQVISGPHYIASRRRKNSNAKEKTKGCDTPISILDRNSSPPAQLYLGVQESCRKFQSADRNLITLIRKEVSHKKKKEKCASIGIERAI